MTILKELLLVALWGGFIAIIVGDYLKWRRTTAAKARAKEEAARLALSRKIEALWASLMDKQSRKLRVMREAAPTNSTSRKSRKKFHCKPKGHFPKCKRGKG